MWIVWAGTLWISRETVSSISFTGTLQSHDGSSQTKHRAEGDCRTCQKIHLRGHWKSLAQNEGTERETSFPGSGRGCPSTTAATGQQEIQTQFCDTWEHCGAFCQRSDLSRKVFRLKACNEKRFKKLLAIASVESFEREFLLIILCRPEDVEYFFLPLPILFSIM